MGRFMAVLILMGVCVCFLAGCANYWYQEGKTFDQCKKDRLECYEDMKKYSTNWKDMGRQEFKLIEDCMIKRGYRLVWGATLHVRVKREDPNLAVPWMVNGVAGFVPEEN